jgi:oligosaccharide translocation protein RFT1
MVKNIFNEVKQIFIVNILQKCIIFFLNQALIRRCSPEIVGHASISMELLLSTLLFLSREGIRVAAIRSSFSNLKERQSMINLCWFPSFILFVIVVFFVTFGNWFLYSKDEKIVILYSIGAFFESLGEPIFNYFQNTLDFGAKIQSETIALFFRSVTTFWCISYLNQGVLSFGYAQIVYGLMYTVALLVRYNHSEIQTRVISTQHEFLPHKLTSGIDNNHQNEKKEMEKINSRFLRKICSNYVNYDLLMTAIKATYSSILKHLLTEADKIVLTFYSSHYNQGIYALTNNYGSLATRILFLPLEDSSRMSFSKQGCAIRQALLKLVTFNVQSFDKSDNECTEEQENIVSLIEELKMLLVSLIQIVATIGVFFLIFGFAYSKLFIELFLNGKWISNETVNCLSTYCIYIFVLGINGISESFVQSVAPPSSFSILNKNLIYCTMIYICTVVFAIQFFGTSGVIMANIFSMSCRIVLNFNYIFELFSNIVYFVGKDDLKNNNLILQQKLGGLVEVSVENQNIKNVTKNIIGIDETLHYENEGLNKQENILRVNINNNLSFIQSKITFSVDIFFPPLKLILILLLCTLIVNFSAYFYNQQTTTKNKNANFYFFVALHIFIGFIMSIVLIFSIFSTLNKNLLSYFLNTIVLKKKID